MQGHRKTAARLFSAHRSDGTHLLALNARIAALWSERLDLGRTHGAAVVGWTLALIFSLLVWALIFRLI